MRKISVILTISALLLAAFPVHVLASSLESNTDAGIIEMSVEDDEVPTASGRATDPATIASFMGMTNKSISYAIVTTDSYVDALVPLAKWKTQKGLNTAIFTTSAIYTNYQGRDNPERIHVMLQEVNIRNPTFEYILIVGDVDQVPIRHLFTNGSKVASYISDTTPTDYYYAALGTSWDTNNNGVWGDQISETDWDPDAYIGRIPADNAAEAAIWANRILTYEKTPSVGPWMEKALVASALYDVPNVIGNMSNVDTEGFFQWWMDNGKEATDQVQTHIPPTMSLKTLHDNNVTGEGTPPHYWGGNYTTPTDELYQTSFRNEFNTGYSVIATASHAWIDGTGIVSYQGNGSEVSGAPNWNARWQNLYTYNDALTASNTDKFSFWYVSACDIGNYSMIGSDNTFEQFFHNPTGGVIGLISASHGDYRGEAYNETISDGDWWLIQEFWDIFFTNGDQRPGKSLFETKKAYEGHLLALGYNEATRNAGFARQSKLVYNLLGDPEVPVWTAQPGTLSVAPSPLPDVYTGERYINVTVTDASNGTPIKGAMVALMGTSIMERGLTDSTGKASIRIVTSAPETVNITVTALNHYPLQGLSFKVLWRPADLKVTNRDIIFDRPAAKAGTTVNTTVFVTNAGETAATSVKVSFYRSDPATGSPFTSLTVDSIGINETGNGTVAIMAQDGANTIWVNVDPENSIPEYLEDNNKASAMFMGTGVDLSVAPEEVTFQTQDFKDGVPALGNGTETRIFANITNSGERRVDGIYVRFFDGDPEQGGARIGMIDQKIDFLETGQKSNISTNWTVNSTGQHVIFVIVDPGDKILEFNETNNVASVPVWSAQPPRWKKSIPEQFVQEDSMLYDAVDLMEMVEDPDTDSYGLQFYVTKNLNPAVNVTITSYNKVDIVPDLDFAGTTRVTIAVSDGFFMVPTEFKVTVSAVNDAPRVDLIPDVTLLVGKAWTFTVNASDPEDDDITFSDDTPLFDIDPNDGSINFIPKKADPYVNIITINVSDDLGASVDVTFTLRILKQNNPPIINVTPGFILKAKVGETTVYTIDVRDADGDELTFTDDFALADVRKEGDKYVLRFTPKETDVRSYRVHLVANDGIDNATADFTVEVAKKEDVQSGKLEMTLNPILIVIIVLAVVIAVGVALALRRSRRADKDEEDDIEKMLEEKLEFKKRKEEAYAQEAAAAAEAGGTEEAGVVEGSPAEGEGAAADDAPVLERVSAPSPISGVKCPHCGSLKVQMIEANSGICNTCGKMVKK